MDANRQGIEVGSVLRENKPQINADERRFNELSDKIIGAAFEVSNVLGAGFLEKVYENALNVELNLRGLKTFQQAPLKVYYKNVYKKSHTRADERSIVDMLSAFICVHLRLKNKRNDFYYPRISAPICGLNTFLSINPRLSSNQR